MSTPDDEWDRLPGGEVFCAVVLLVAIVLVAAAHSPGPLGRGLAAALLACCWLTGAVARHLVAGEHRDWPANTYIVVLTSLFAVAVLISPTSSVALFALGPQSFGVLTQRRACAVVVLLSAAPALRFAVVPPSGGSLVSFAATAALAITFSFAIGSWMCRIIDQSAGRADLIRELRTARAEVEQLSEERGMMAERERLAREIHDTLTQGFTSIIMLLQAMEPAIETGTAAHQHLMTASQTARENLAEARALVAELAPASLAGSLEAALHRLTSRVAAEMSIPVSFSMSGAARALPPDRELALLRAAQEGLANASKHARASSAGVTLTYAGRLARLTVDDDGRGFDSSAPASGFGLAGMRSRAEQAGGTLTIQTAHGQGTSITFEIPVAAVGCGSGQESTVGCGSGQESSASDDLTRAL